MYGLGNDTLQTHQIVLSCFLYNIAWTPLIEEKWQCFLLESKHIHVQLAEAALKGAQTHM